MRTWGTARSRWEPGATLLGAFVNEVNAQSGKKVTAAQAAALVALANNIKAVLGY